MSDRPKNNQVKVWSTAKDDWVWRDLPPNPVQELREVVREAHEAISDLTRLVKEAKAVVGGVEDEVGKQVGATISEAVRIGLKGFRDVTEQATDEATEAVFDRFDNLMRIILGETKQQKSKHDGNSLIDTLEQAQARGLIKPDADLSFLRSPLSREVT